MASPDDVRWTRRRALTLLGLAGMVSVAGCGSGNPRQATTTPTPTRQASMRRIAYGKGPSQFADLYLPASTAGKVPVTVVVHGGYWGSGYGNALGAPLAEDLAGHGVAAWNIEYRRIGIGGGWPATFEDAARAMDSLATLGQDAAGGRLDLTKVVVVGHSAGGHIAAWLAARHTIPAGSVGAGPKVSPVGYVSQAGVLDLVGAFDQHLGGGAVAALMGGSPEQYPERYAFGSPLALLPYGIPGTLVHGLTDHVVPIQQSDTFAAKAKQIGDQVDEIRMAGVDHFMLIDPTTPAWAACRKVALGYLRLS
jgi:acetyl esterase/lipase